LLCELKLSTEKELKLSTENELKFGNRCLPKKRIFVL
jgi:hypothetical protein